MDEHTAMTLLIGPCRNNPLKGFRENVILVLYPLHGRSKDHVVNQILLFYNKKSACLVLDIIPSGYLYDECDCINV